MPTTCSVLDCHNNSKKTKKEGLHYHQSLSREDGIKKIWLKFTRRPIETINQENFYICSEHFEADAFERDIVHELLGLPLRKKLKADAIPTIYPETRNVDRVIRYLGSKGKVDIDIPSPSSQKIQQPKLSASGPGLTKKRKVETDVENFRQKQNDVPCCLLCYSLVNYEICDDDESSSSLLLNQLHVIFILRKIFEMPSHKLVEFVKKAGNPEDWISFCENCSESIRKIKILYDELMIATEKFQKAKECIKRLVQESQDNRLVFAGDGVGVEKMEITNQCRNYLCKKNGTSEQTSEDASEIATTGCNGQPSQPHVIETNEIGEGQMIEIYFTHDKKNEVSKFRPNPKSYWNSLFSPYDDNNPPSLTHLKPISASHVKVLTTAHSNLTSTVSPQQFSSTSSISTSKAILITTPVITKTFSIKQPNKKPRETPKQTKASVVVKRKIKKTVGCPFCRSFSRKRENYVNFCRHLDKCKGLKMDFDSDAKPPLLKCSVCKEFECSVNNRTLYVDHIIWCHSEATSETLSPPPAIPFSRRVFQCKLCKTKQYMKFEHFLKHFKDHKTTLFKCFKCDYKCSNTRRLLIHWKKTHNSDVDANPDDLGEYVKDDITPEIPWWCPRCPLRFSSVEDRDVHLENAHELSKESDPNSSGKFDCGTCSKSFLTLDEVKLHTETTHEVNVVDQKDFTCDEAGCGEKFPSENKYEEHRRRVHRLDLLQCEYCGTEFVCAGSLQRHLRYRHKEQEEKNFTCDFCHKSFKTSSNLTLHKNVVHIKKFRHHCHICDKGFTCRMKVITHLAKVHKAVPARFPCTWEGCKKVFHEKRRLEEHMSFHKGQPEYKCGTCGKFYYARRQLNRHMELHKNKDTRPFQCEMCPKRFAASHHLYFHKRQVHLKIGKSKRKAKI